MSQREISEDVSGNITTIRQMKKVARLRAGDPLIRKLALNIVQQYGVPSHHFIDEALAIGDYVKNKVRYVRDPNNIEYLTDPLKMVKMIQEDRAQGDCDDMALLAATLLLATGHEPFFRAVRYDQSVGNYNHIYTVVYDRNMRGPKQRVVLDCILKDEPIGTEMPHQSGEEYAI